MNTKAFEDMISDAITTAQKNAFDAAIELCRSMEGYCNECCARAIENFRDKVCEQDDDQTLHS